MKMNVPKSRNLINSRVPAIIEVSRETLGRNINNMCMTVCLPGRQYDLLTTMHTSSEITVGQMID